MPSASGRLLAVGGGRRKLRRHDGGLPRAAASGLGAPLPMLQILAYPTHRHVRSLALLRRAWKRLYAGRRVRAVVIGQLHAAWRTIQAIPISFRWPPRIRRASADAHHDGRVRSRCETRASRMRGSSRTRASRCEHIHVRGSDARLPAAGSSGRKSSSTDRPLGRRPRRSSSGRRRGREAIASWFHAGSAILSAQAPWAR